MNQSFDVIPLKLQSMTKYEIWFEIECFRNYPSATTFSTLSMHPSRPLSFRFHPQESVFIIKVDALQVWGTPTSLDTCTSPAHSLRVYQKWEPPVSTSAARQMRWKGEQCQTCLHRYDNLTGFTFRRDHHWDPRTIGSHSNGCMDSVTSEKGLGT